MASIAKQPSFWLDVKKEYVIENFENLLTYLRYYTYIDEEEKSDGDFNRTFKCLKEVVEDYINEIFTIEKEEVKRLEQIKNELKKQKKLRKEIVRDGNSGISDYIAKNVKDITTKMGVFDYISSEKDYIFTKNIKALSGAILHKISISYKVAYLKALEEFLGIRLPFIIDSPCSGEVTLENAKEMLKIVMQELPEHQIIVASIHKFDEINFDRIKLFEGIFGGYEQE